MKFRHFTCNYSLPVSHYTKDFLHQTKESFGGFVENQGAGFLFQFVQQLFAFAGFPGDKPDENEAIGWKARGAQCGNHG